MARPTVLVELNYGIGTAAPAALALDTGRVDINILDGAATGSSLILNDATYGTLDTARLAGDAYAAGYWTDMGEFCDRVSTRRGRTRSLESFNAGTMSAGLDNSDRRFDPTNLTGPYVSGGRSAIRPMRPVRVRALTDDGRSWALFSGYADAWDIEWSDPAVSDCALSATDAFKVLSDFDPLEVAPVGAGEDSGARVTRILNNAAFPVAARAIDTGNSTLQATTLASNALAELKLVTDSERGSLYVDGAGKVTFRRRAARQTDAVSINVQVTFGDADDELPYADLAVSYDDELIRNVANVARVGGTSQTASDATSIADYQRHTFTRTDLIFDTDGEALSYARTVVSVYKDGDLRFDRLVLEPDGDDALWPYALGLDIGHRIRVRRRPPGGGSMIERECWIEGITHDVSAAGKWLTSYDLSNASTSGGLLLDSATRGTLDTAANNLTY